MPICPSCARDLRRDQIIVGVSSHLEEDIVGYRQNMRVVGMRLVGPPPGRPEPALEPDGTYSPMLGTRQVWVSRLADGTTRRYTASADPVWRAGERICRDCRDARVPRSVSGRES
jgi:hypothetical protein